ncbi:hypothetical protein NC661_20290 [Aquibacillus koreensis]|uniref:Uncharacterized protein n=1 Tax=Aquibacillus koreensis TaxID=279446 RepID=A0A9X4AK46_9BACI|nr:hypothetical protein [Aquibacillus koreensis]MCT2535491.1 hypothetical protein [Aquibacillus koreensis]MDC3422696.1 hypothetical protein [Aquibacillus koreensis]
MLKIVDRLAELIYAIFTIILRPFSYILAGGIIVATPLYLIVWIIEFYTTSM